MPKNIVVLSDGTGNSSARLLRTNIWRLYEALDLGDPKKQIAVYDDGVGTSSFKPLAIVGGVFGVGLKRNVLDLYRFVCRNYEGGKNPDRIFGFGFSRGAFTIRVLAGLIADQGLVRYDDNESRLARKTKAAYREYRKRFAVTGGLVKLVRILRDLWLRMWWRLRRFGPYQPKEVDPDCIHFLGVWDTVGAYGGPIEEITRGIDQWIWPLSMPDRFMSYKVKRACHALALDDERYSFHPLLWDEHEVMGPEKRPRPMNTEWSPPAEAKAEIDRQRLSQVWFTGMHSDVGGGYAQDGLAYVSLDWMMDRAEVYGLKINDLDRQRFSTYIDPYGKLNDSRSGLGAYYRYKPRKLADLYAAEPTKPKLLEDLSRGMKAMVRRDSPVERDGVSTASALIHESVCRRIKGGADGYATIVLPDSYRITTKKGEILPDPLEDAGQAEARAISQERVWNWVWGRRVVYFATLFLSLAILAMPVWQSWRPGRGAGGWAEILIPVVAGLGQVLPDLASPWIKAFQQGPERLAVLGGLIIVLLWFGRSLETHIGDVMRQIWALTIAGKAPPPPTLPRIHNSLCWLRASSGYRGFFYALANWILPTFFAAVIVVALFYVGLVVVSRVLFGVGDAIGVVCRPSGQTVEAGQVETAAKVIQFETKDVCHATGVTVAKGATYRVKITVTEPWEDGYDAKTGKPGIPTGPDGFGQDRATRMMALGLPFRRQPATNWFQLVARIGSRGFIRQPLSFKPEEDPCACPKPTPVVFTASFTARASGEVFFFVNDSVLGFPGYVSTFYRTNNKGKANIVVLRESEPQPR
jgi:uncharacterized protein (DUF2235 family)